MDFENMTSFCYQTAVLAFVAAELFPLVTVTPPDSGTVRGHSPTGSRQMPIEQQDSGGTVKKSPDVIRINRAATLPSQHTYVPILQEQWIAPRVQEDASHPADRMREAITSDLARWNAKIYSFVAPNAGLEVDVRFLGDSNAMGSQLVFMLRKHIEDKAEFEKLQRETDPRTGRPYISPKAEWKEGGYYPIGAFIATKNQRNADELTQPMNPYDYVDDPARFSTRDPRSGKTPTAVVELFGLPKDQEGVAKGQVMTDFYHDFPDVRGRSGLSSFFGSLLGGGQQQQRQQPQQQQYPGQQPPPQADCPSAAAAALGSFLGGLTRGQDPKQAAAQAAAAAARTPKPRGCE